MKLVRDKYDGVIPKEELVLLETDAQKFDFLKKKLLEELKELEESDYLDPSEFADVLEVLYAIGVVRNIPEDEIAKHREEKFSLRGGFEKGLVWLGKGKD